jgi:hypothetical protein
MIVGFASVFRAIALPNSVPQTAVGCPPQPMTRAGALATEYEWVRAIEARNAAALSCILAPEFADTNWRGEMVPRSTILARLPSKPRSRLRLSDLSVVRDGPIAIVRGVNTQSGSDGRISGAVRFTDVFVYRGGKWRAISAQETLIGKE